MWTCKNCSSRQWDASTICPQCGRSSEGIFKLREEGIGANFYTVTLGPGQVGYFDVDALAANGIEDLISQLRAACSQPRITASPNVWEVDALVPMEPWDDRLRLHHAYLRFCGTRKLPSSVYYVFHSQLKLTMFEFDECLKAWEVKAWISDDVLKSFEASVQHVTLTANSRSCVFRKTPFVTARLTLLAEMAERERESKQREDESQRLAENWERLQKGKFSTFVYIMEDLRNGRFKIGRSIAPNVREKTLQSEAPETVLRFAIPTDGELEKMLHLRFAVKRVRGEWFALSPDDLLWVIGFLRDHGDTDRASVDHQWVGTLFLLAKSSSPQVT